MTTPRRRLRAALAAAAIGTTLLGGCAVFSPMQTDEDYQAADGVNATFGDLDVRGVVVVSNAKDSEGQIVGQLVNTSNEDIDVSFAADGGEGGQVTVDRHSSLALGDDTALVLPKVGVAPGDVLQLQVTTAGTGVNVVQVPVLPATAYYESHKPAGAPAVTEAATPSASASASASH
ncbi:hypothetical protein N803_03830 [Knoellia subterranea KCTC 19937]|uniref:Lipoprotein n=1 Tax=Knoellia subterranea KCTC 19937 TaxID=1385521 RepID=A0A0A0JLZ9_9MICO|nr:hypothetical protein N803_03830 [Knoellia subterranea KCTC 19937]